MAVTKSEVSPEELVERARDELESARRAVTENDAAIEKKENEIQTAISIGEREIANLERQVEDARGLDELYEAREHQESAARKRAELANRVNQLESKLGDLKGRRIEMAARQTRAEANLADIQAREADARERQAVSGEQLKRADELEKRLARLESERADLVQQIEQYAPVVEAQREVATASGAKELSEAYASQADAYRAEWRRWLICLGVAIVVALVGGVAVILITHPAGDATTGQIVSRVAIEILVLGLLVYGVRVTAHQFRVHRHLETMSRGKAAALITFNRLVAGPGEAEVRTAVAVALAQAVFDSNTTGFIDSSQDGVTFIERIAAPISQRLTNQ